MSKTKRCTELKEGDAVLFYVDTYREGKKELRDGNVTQVCSKSIAVCYLEGYKSETDAIPFEDMVAVYSEDGEEQHFPGYRGKGFDLIP